MVNSHAPRRVARKAEQSRPFRWLARAGYAASGIVHILIAAIALAVALGGEGTSDQSGALMIISVAPLGFVLLWIIAITLWALGAWQLLEGILVRNTSDDAVGLAKKWGLRVGAWGQAVIFTVLGLLAASVGLGARVNAEEAAQDASRGVLELPGGSIALGVVGLGIGIGGISFVVMGVRRTFRTKVDLPETGPGRAIAGLGVVGFVAKGLALIIVGVLLLVAAFKGDATGAGGLDSAFDALIDLAYGPWLVGAVAGGFLAYGLFCFFRARYARI